MWQQWLASWAGASLEGHIPLLDLVVAAAELYFAFQFLTDLAALAENLQGPEENLAGRLRGLRTANLLLSTACCLVSWVPEVALRDWAMAALLGFSLVGMVVAVILVVTLFQLRARVPDRELPQQNI